MQTALTLKVLTYVPVILDLVGMVVTVLMLVNAMMGHIAVLKMLHVKTHMGHTIVPVTMDSVVMDSIVKTLMNAFLVHIHVV